MIQRLSHATVFVLDQEESLRFYRDKLGFEVRMDSTMDGGFRWLTVGPKSQPELQLILMPVVEGFMLSKENAAKFRELLKAGVIGVGVLETDDCRGTNEELRAKGVEFRGPPEERFYGIEALMKDNSGNWFSLVQRPK